MLSPRELRALGGFRLAPRKSFPGKVRGERLTSRRGLSIEFADYREYAEGDDLRHLDWNVLARLETPVMRTYRDEEDLAVHIRLDASPSMSFGEPSKLAYARRRARAVGVMGLIGGDAISIRPLGDTRRFPPLRGRASYLRLQEGITAAEERASEGFARDVRTLASTSISTGLVIIISDALDPDAAAALNLLGGRGHEVWLLQTLSAVEIDPDLEGDLRLIDAESGAEVEITANSEAIARYRENLRAHNEGLASAVRRIGGRFANVAVGTPLEDVVQKTMRREGWLR
jgi:uncharacterized protein (DUF58 family)